MAKNVSLTPEDSTDGPDANGLEIWLELPSSEDSKREQAPALNGEREPNPEPSAGIRDLESSEDSSETERDAQSGQEPENNGPDVLPSKSRAKLSRDSRERVRAASPTAEAKTDGQDANGLESGKELESSEDSTEEPTDALSGPRATSRRPSAGTTSQLS